MDGYFSFQLIFAESFHYTANDRYSGEHYSGNDHYRGQIIRKKTILEEIELGLFTSFEDATALVQYCSDWKWGRNVKHKLSDESTNRLNA